MKTKSDFPSTQRRQKLTVEKVTEALRNSAGIVAHAARMLRVSRQTIYTFINDNPELEGIVDEVREELSDLAELKMIELIKQGNGPTIRWYLSHRARDRGYGDHQVLFGPEGGAIQVETPPPDFDAMTDEQLEAYIAWQESMKPKEIDAS